jgi:hypothetical protein
VPGALAAGALDRAARALAADPVYVDPQAQEHLTAAQERRIEHEIATTRSGPVYIAVLPRSAENEAGGDPTEAVRTIAVKLHRRGTYAGVIGNHFRALSNMLSRGVAGRLATDALNAHRSDGVAAVLVDFVDRVAAARSDKGGGGRSVSWWWLIVLGALAVFFVSRRRRKRHAQAAELAEVRATAKEDLVALAEDVQRLEHRVEGNEEAEPAYNRALAAYDRGSQAFDRARSAKELAEVARALEDGRYEMAVAEAAVEGRPPPERTPPCFFDPRHGPSSREVEWAPPGGTPRPVPACEADAQRVERGEEPQSRQVPVGGAPTPYWAAGPAYGGYFGGFLPGLLLGELLGGGWGWGGYDAGSVPPAGDGFESGDFGGGGGDFGGGDFGGGGNGGGGDF